LRILPSRVRRLLSVLGEAQELSADPDALHRHLLSGLGEILGAAAVMRVQVHDYVAGGGFDIRDGLDVGFDDGIRRRLADYYYHRSGHDPVLSRSIPRHDELARDGVMTIRRSDLVGDRDWYESAFVADFRRPARIDHSMYTSRVIGPQRADGVGVWRAWGEPNFTDEDVEIMRLFDLEVLRRFPLPGSARHARLPAAVEATLSPRERATYAWLLTGASEKEVAARLGISPTTTHGYVKGLYRKLGTRSRAELMALALRAQ
jgi:DNA-binding CsgD family transcriptional regulator